MFGIFGGFRVLIFFYIAVSILVTAYAYDYVGKFYPNVNLPYKKQVYGLQKKILEIINEIIKE